MSGRTWFRALSVVACLALAATAAPADAGTPAVAPTPAAALVDNPDGTHSVTLDLAGDTWVSSSGATASQTTSPELRVGSNNLGLVKSRSYLDFDYAPLAGIPADAVITSADLTLSNFVTGSCRGTAVRASRITGAWTLDGLKWSAQPAATTLGSGTSTASYGASACPTEGDVTFDVSGIVKSWLGGTAERGILVKADREGAAAGYRKYRSSENGDTTKSPALTVTYNSYPGTPTDVAFAPGTGSYVTSLTPTLSATVSDPDGPVSGYFEVHKGTGALSPIVWSGASDPVASGDEASVTVPEGILLDGTVYSVGVRGFDGTLKSKGLAATAFLVDVTAPTVTISSDVYADGEWLRDDPTSSTFTFDGSTDTAGFYLEVDGAEYTVGSNAAGGNYKVTWTPTPGWHVLAATPVDKAGNVGEQQTFSFGAGPATFVTPTLWQTSTADFPVVMNAPAGATGATLLWRVFGEETWHSAAHVSKGDGDWDGTVTTADGHSSTGALTWHASEEPFGTGTVPAPALLQIQGCFQYDDAEDSCTAPLFVGLDDPDEE